MSREYLFKSGINIQVLFFFCIFVCFTFNSFWILSASAIYKSIIIIIVLGLLYLLIYYLVNRCYFYEGRLEIKYFFRLRRSVIRYNYSEIASIKYLCTYSIYTPPTIIIKLNKNESKSSNNSFSFPLRSFNKRRDLLRFLASKGLPIEIDSIHEKDQDILDLPH